MDHNDNQNNRSPFAAEALTRRNIWQVVPDFFTFIKRPYILAHYQKLTPLALCQLFLLIMLNIVVAIILAALIVEPYKELMEIPDSGLQALEGSPLNLFLLAVVLAPLIEEIGFRGWLRGTQRAFSITGLLLLYGAGAAIIIYVQSSNLIMNLTIFLWSFLLAFDGYFWLRKIWNDMRPVSFFKQYFPIIFYAGAFTFGAIHISNFEHDNMIELLPMTITQCFAGLLFGYIRLRFGLLAAIGSHAAFNGTLLGLSFVGGQI